MQFSVKWLDYSDRHVIKDIAKSVYTKPSHLYPTNLSGDSPLYNYFLVPPSVIGSDQRKVAVIVNSNGEPVVATGVRELGNIPAWLLSWTVSSISSMSFVAAWRQTLNFTTAYYESKSINEFYVVSPVEREEAYSRMTSFMRNRYWTFVEQTIPKGTRPTHSLYHTITGNILYTYDINIRRYILKRDPV